MEQRIVDDECDDLLPFDDLAHLWCGRTGVEVDDPEPGLGRRNRHLHEVAMVPAGHADAFAPLDAESVQTARQVGRPPVELGERDLAGVVDDRRPIR